MLLLGEALLHFQRNSGARCCCSISILQQQLPCPVFSPCFYTENLSFCLLTVLHSYPQRMKHHLSGTYSPSNPLTGLKAGSSSLAIGRGNSKVLLRFVFYWLEVWLLRGERMGPPRCHRVPALQPVALLKVSLSHLAKLGCP